MEFRTHIGWKYYVRVIPRDKSHLRDRICSAMKSQGWDFCGSRSEEGAYHIIFKKKDEQLWVLEWSVGTIQGRKEVFGSREMMLAEMRKIGGNVRLIEETGERFSRFDRLMNYGEEIDEPVDPVVVVEEEDPFSMNFPEIDLGEELVDFGDDLVESDEDLAAEDREWIRQQMYRHDQD